MRKPFTRKQQEETQKIWKTTNHEAQFNPLRTFYGVIKIGDKSFIVEYESKFRSEVKAIFEEESRLAGGKLEYIGVYK